MLLLQVEQGKGKRSVDAEFEGKEREGRPGNLGACAGTT